MTDDRGLGGRLPLLRPSDLAHDAQALYANLVDRQRIRPSPFRVTDEIGAFIGPFNACLHAPLTGGAFLAMHDAEAEASPLSARLREVVILSVGASWSAPYELYAHRAVALSVGLSAEEVTFLARGDPHPNFTDAERAIQQLVHELMRDRSVSDTTYAACERLLGRDGLVAVAFLAATYAGTSTVLAMFAVPAPEEDAAPTAVTGISSP